MSEESSFYATADWKRERADALGNWDGHCRECGKEIESPHVHHILGLRRSVYTPLCVSCHNRARKDRRPRCNTCGEVVEWAYVVGEGWRPLKENIMGFHRCHNFRSLRLGETLGPEGMGAASPAPLSLPITYWRGDGASR